MVIAILAILGLILGSFTNALVWRLFMQSKPSSGVRPKLPGKAGKTSDRQLATSDYSILSGRSMCPHCRHTLAAGDLVPLLSWIILRGRCRYCHEPISVQYPLVEAIMALVFVGSWVLWPVALAGAASLAVFALWLAMVVLLVALAVYDLKWRLLPDKLVLILAVFALAQAIISILSATDPVKSLISHIIALAIGGGLFYLIFVGSNGKWIGGGDVKLGFVLGLIAAAPGRAILLLFLAAVAGTLASLPLMAAKRLKTGSPIPFGPFLILATGLTVLFGGQIISWYTGLFALG